ncbi:MAG: hypothetical protein KDD50_10260, partial [Bdellovibrionales bacterium]|nr:hypothetical protein [Bdellovibrionales bacterium]
YYNPEDKVVIAQDFQTALPENICQVLEWPSINLELEMKKFEDEIVKIIQIHNIEIVSRSMRRNVYRQFGIASRTCDNFDLKKLINLVRLEQGLLENIVKRTNVIFLNSALNDPENYTLWDKGERFVNPLYKYRPKGILFVGYTNNPNFLFRASGSPIVDRMISSNQRQNGNIIDFYIDGNLHEDDLNRSIDEYWETEDYYNLGSLWWERDSFHFIYGHSIKAHLYLSPENIVTSGFSTSWATPIAASLVNYFLTKERVPRDKLIEELKDKVFDPYSNKQFLRRE